MMYLTLGGFPVQDRPDTGHMASSSRWRVALAKYRSRSSSVGCYEHLGSHDRRVDGCDDSEYDEAVIKPPCCSRACASAEMEHRRVNETKRDAVGVGKRLVEEFNLFSIPSPHLPSK